jgi:serine/threonine-protein kinase
VHRDVKPQNVIVEDGTGRSVLVDFGIATLASDPAAVGLFGTPQYMPPEYASGGKKPSPQSDMYSLGCLAYELLTGRLPFEAGTSQALVFQHMRAAPALPSSHRPELGSIDDVLMRLLEKDPMKRFDSCDALAGLLDDRLAMLASPQAILAPMDEISHITALPSAAGVRVLVVDDDTTMSRAVARCAEVAFADIKVSISRAKTGNAAIESAKRRRPDLVLLDYQLPDLDGVEVLSRLRSLRDGARIEVIVASGAVGASERWRFGILGVRDFLDKPLDFVRAVGMITAIAKRRRWIGEDAETGRIA